MFINILKAILFGIVEGITEWLPISSTGHMIILESLLDVKNTFSDAFWELFLVVIQLGAIIAVIICFFKKLWPFGKTKEKEEKKNIWLIWAKVLVACIPAAVVGLLLDDWLNEHLYNAITVSVTLIVFGIFFIISEIWNKKREFKINEVKDLSFKMALIIGLIQLIALIPGVSRSGVTILGAMLIGCSRTVSAEFSFFLSIPVMLGASLLKGVKFFLDEGTLTSNEWVFLGVGVVVAFLVSLFIIKFLMSFIKKHDFKPFGYYRIVLGVLLLILFLTHVITV